MILIGLSRVESKYSSTSCREYIFKIIAKIYKAKLSYIHVDWYVYILN